MTSWDLKAKFYNGARALPIIRQIYEAENRNLQRLIPAQTFAAHLDIGTGTGTSLPLFPPSQFTVVSDCSQKMLTEAEQAFRFPAIMLDANGKLPFQASTFDLITAIGILEYLQNAELFFAETHRIAKCNAAFILTSTPAGLFAQLRIMTGSRPRQRSGKAIRSVLRRCGWQVQGHEKSLMQEQWFCRKA